MIKKEIIMGVLKAIKDGHSKPQPSDFGINIQEFGDIVDMIINEELVMNAKVVRGGQGNRALVTFLDSAVITIKGINYLEENDETTETDAVDFTDRELENKILFLIYDNRGSKKKLTLGRIRKLLVPRIHSNRIEWILNNLVDLKLVRKDRLPSHKGFDGKMTKGEFVYEITPNGMTRVENTQLLDVKNIDVRSEVKLAASKKIFIIHGHDNEMKREVQLLLSRANLDDVVLHECPDKGRTIIDKLIEESSNASYIIALLSPDDMLEDGNFRARQNVILEIGYFLGKLGKERVRLLKRGNVEIPSDLQGILYQDYDDTGSWRFKLLKEINATGVEVEMQKVIEKY